MLRVLLATASTELDAILHSHPAIERVIDLVAHAQDILELQSLSLAYQPDVILLDADLPGAFEAATSLLHLTLRHSRLLVFVLHRNIPTDQLTRWLPLGAYDILTTPLTTDLVVSALIRAGNTFQPALYGSVQLTEDKPDRMLLVSRTAGAAVRLADILRQPCEVSDVDQAYTAEQVLAQAVQVSYSVVLIDADQFGRGAFDMAAQLRQYAPMTYVILLAARVDAERVRYAAQSGVRDYLIKPPTLESFRVALIRARWFSQALALVTHKAAIQDRLIAGPTLDGPDSRILAMTRRGIILTVYSPGGGNGSTALACGLALLLRKRDMRVVLVDADLQFGNAAALLGLSAGVTLDDLAARIAFVGWPEEELIHHHSGLHVLPAPENIVRGTTVGVEELSQVMYRLRSHYEVVVVDTPHALNDHSVRLLKLADHILVPVRTWQTQRQRLTALQTLLQDHGFALERLHLVQSGFERAPDLEAAAVINLDILASQLAAGDDLDLDGLEGLVDQLLA